MTSTCKYNIFGKRFLAGLIDSLIFIPFSMLDNKFEETGNKALFICWILFHTVCWTLYVVIGHSIYGQTIGKRLMGIKVFNVNEKDLISYEHAFLRESVYFFTVIAGVIYLTINTSKVLILNEEIKDTYYNDIVGLTSGVWLILELLTMWFNKKRRALHDFIAGSVVVDLTELRREDLEKRQNELITSLQNK
ncbi:MAG TPA: RDD family protein [Sediminibacterium sp.]|nr:RDD family protein [Sediminibacterium sp.]